MAIPEEMDIDLTTDITESVYRICDGPILLKHRHLGTEIISSCSSSGWTKKWRVTRSAGNILQNFVALSFAILRPPS